MRALRDGAMLRCKAKPTIGRTTYVCAHRSTAVVKSNCENTNMVLYNLYIRNGELSVTPLSRFWP